MTQPFDAFDYHQPTPEQLARIESLRSAAKACRDAIEKALPVSSREKVLALTNLEQALMWANKAAVSSPLLALAKPEP